MVDINIPKIVRSYVPLHRSTPLTVWKAFIEETETSQFNLFAYIWQNYISLTKIWN